MAVLAEFRRKAEETCELHASSPGAGEGNCRRFVVVDTSHSDLTHLRVSRAAALSHAPVALTPAPPKPVLAVREISGCDLRCGPLMSRDSSGPHIAAPPTAHSRPPAQRRRRSAAPIGAPGAIASTAIAIGTAARSSARRPRRRRMPSDRSLRAVKHLFLVVREFISGCDLRCGPLCRETPEGLKLRLRQSRIQGPPLSAGGAPTGAPGVIASAAIAIGAAAAAARC